MGAAGKAAAEGHERDAGLGEEIEAWILGACPGQDEGIDLSPLHDPAQAGERIAAATAAFG